MHGVKSARYLLSKIDCDVSSFNNRDLKKKANVLLSVFPLALENLTNNVFPPGEF